MYQSEDENCFSISKKEISSPFALFNSSRPFAISEIISRIFISVIDERSRTTMRIYHIREEEGEERNVASRGTNYDR